MHFIDKKNIIFAPLTHIRLHVIICYIHQRLTGKKEHNFSYINCVWRRDSISEELQDNSLSPHAHPSASRYLNIMCFLTKNISEISQYLPRYMDCTFFAGFCVCGFFPTSRRSSFLEDTRTHLVCWRYTAFLYPSGERRTGKEFKMCGESRGRGRENKTNPNQEKNSHKNSKESMFTP